MVELILYTIKESESSTKLEDIHSICGSKSKEENMLTRKLKR